MGIIDYRSFRIHLLGEVAGFVIGILRGSRVRRDSVVLSSKVIIPILGGMVIRVGDGDEVVLGIIGLIGYGGQRLGCMMRRSRPS